MLSDDKTEFIVTASAAVNTIRVGDCDVSKVTVVRNLGAWFDDQIYSSLVVCVSYVA